MGSCGTKMTQRVSVRKNLSSHATNQCTTNGSRESQKKPFVPTASKSWKNKHTIVITSRMHDVTHAAVCGVVVYDETVDVHRARCQRRWVGPLAHGDAANHPGPRNRDPQGERKEREAEGTGTTGTLPSSSSLLPSPPPAMTPNVPPNATTVVACHRHVRHAHTKSMHRGSLFYNLEVQFRGTAVCR